MTILWQGGQFETLSDIQPGTGGSGDITSAGWFDPVYADIACTFTGTAYIEADCGAPQTNFCTTALHVYGSGGNNNPGNTGQGVNLLDSSKVPWFRLHNPTTLGVYLFDQWNGTAWVTVATMTAAPAVGMWTINVGNLGTSSGTLIIHRSGVLMYAGSSLNFSSVANLQFVRWSCFGGDGTRTTWTEQIIANHNLVNNRLKTVRATSNGTDATDGFGSFTDIAENGLVSGNDSTFIELTAAGQKRSFKGAARTLTFPTSKGCSVPFRAMRQDATGPQHLKPFLLISGTRYYGTTIALTLGWKNYQYVWEVDPSTGLPWTTSVINGAGLEWGLEGVA